MVLADLSFTFDTGFAVVSIIGTTATFAVMRWRVKDLDRRVEKLETKDEANAPRLSVIETKMDNLVQLCSRIAKKLDLS